MLRATNGRSTASPAESGSMAPALQMAMAQILDMSRSCAEPGSPGLVPDEI